MKISTAIITIFLVFGLLGVPSGVFAQESSSTGSEIALQYSNSIVLDNMIPLLKGGSRGGSSSSKSSSSKKFKVDGDDDDSDDSDDSTDDDSSGGFGWTTAIIILIVLGLIGVLAWFFFLRK